MERIGELVAEIRVEGSDRGESSRGGAEAVFEETVDLDGGESPAIRAMPKKKSHRLTIAAFFLGLNAVILTLWLLWPSGETRRPSSETQDTAAPFEEASKPVPPKVAPPPTEVSEDAPQEVQEASRVYKQARMKLDAANRWKPTHPDKARGFAREAIKLAPNTDVAEKAQKLIDSLP